MPIVYSLCAYTTCRSQARSLDADIEEPGSRCSYIGFPVYQVSIATVPKILDKGAL